MDSIWYKILLVWFVLQTASSERNPEVCNVVTESFGLIPPPLPTNFEMKSEHADFLLKTLNWGEIYFDNTYLRGKFMFISKGVENHILFDYNTSQVIYYKVIHPGVSIQRDPLSDVCVTENIETSKFSYIFGYRDGNFETKHSRMYNTYQVMRYGGQYQYAFNGTQDLEDRGLKANKFFGCIYDSSTEITAAINYYFSGQEMISAAGTMEALVDGVENAALLSVPLKVEVKGTVEDPTGALININTSQSMSWFKGEPEFDKKNFRIPLGVFCEGYRGWKAMPMFPPAFSARLEITAFTQDMWGKMQTAELTSSSQLWYYNEKGLARRDFTPVIERDSDINAKFQNYAPVKTIYDYRVGIVYIINKPSGRCYARAIIPGDFFEINKNEMYIDMGSPEEIFLMDQEAMEYKGQHFTRDIECDVWSGKHFSKNLNTTLYKETYMSTNGWHEDAEEKILFGVPISHTIITDQDGGLAQTVVENHFFKFKAYAPPLAVFDITPCIETIEHAYYLILVNVPENDAEEVYKYKYQFLEAAQYYLADISQVVSPLRVQKLDLTNGTLFHMLTFALVGKPDLKTKVPFKQAGAEISEAAANLKKFVDEENFEIKFLHPGSSGLKTVTASPNSFFRFPSGKLDFADIENMVSTDPPRNDEIRRPRWYMADTQLKAAVKTGMSPGALAGLSIAMLLIGIAIGIAIMYLYIRKYSAESLQDQYVMQNK